MSFLLTISAVEWLGIVCFRLMVVGVVLSVVGGIIEEIILRVRRKKEMERRALKRSGAPIRPTRRY